MCNDAWVDDRTRIVFLSAATVVFRHGWERFVLRQSYTEDCSSAKRVKYQWWTDGAHAPLHLLRHAIGDGHNLKASSLGCSPLQILQLDVEPNINGTVGRQELSTAAETAIREYPDVQAFSIPLSLVPLAKYALVKSVLVNITASASQSAAPSAAPSAANKVPPNPCDSQAKAGANCLRGGAGFPDCTHRSRGNSAVRCAQTGESSQFQVAVVGDSLTAGTSVASRSLTYSSRLQEMLGSRVAVTNLGAASAKLLNVQVEQKHIWAQSYAAMRSYWPLGQAATLNNSRWDAALIMLGTNDCSRSRPALALGKHCAKAAARGGRLLTLCPWARAYAELVSLIRSRGKNGRQPAIFLLVPPPVVMSCDRCACEIEDECVNEVLPVVFDGLRRALELPKASLISAFEAAREEYARRPYACSHIAPQSNASFCHLYECDRVHTSALGHARIADAVAPIGLTGGSNPLSSESTLRR